MSRIVQGKAFTWERSDSPIGSGDAGEVFAVSCVEQPEQRGVMKKPAQIATGGTIQRQAGQIAQEALALQRLDGLPRGKAHPPRLLDEAPEFTRGTANYFIISETALGEDLESMLASARKAGKPFPRRVIITVLDALFDLFSRAHKAKVLWNDVKLDHIYWHNPTGQVGVIDWGNALFLNQDPAERRNAPPRWEDYRQMVSSLGSFLKQNAPELYADLGWDEFEIKELDASRVSVLARRIAYQQQVIALRVMEFQALMRVVLHDEPTLEGLQKIQTYQNALEQIGAPWNIQGVLGYAQQLITQTLANGERQAAVNATLLTWELFDDQLDLSWHLLREYFRNVDILSHTSLEKLVAFTLNNQWLDALWTLTVIAQEHSAEPTVWWHRLMPILRQKAFGMNTPLPYQTCQSLLEWSTTQGSGGMQQIGDLTKLLNSWHSKGRNLKESPLDYQLLDWLQKGVDLPIRLRSEVKKSFAAGEEPVRGLMEAWRNAGWDAFPKAFQKVIAWDPDRWGIIPLARLMESFIEWLGDLHTGPKNQDDLKQTIQDFSGLRPDIEALMGKPSWLSALIDMLDAIHRGEPIATYREEVKNWCPWLLSISNINETQQHNHSADEGTATAAIIHFEGHLKSWSDLETGFHLITSTAPSYETFCRQLIAGFTSALSLNFDTATAESICKDIPHPEFARCYEALHLMINWRKKIIEHDLAGALQVMIGHPMPDWRLLDYARKATQDWVEYVLPALGTLKSFTPLSETCKPKGTNEPVADVCVSCLQLRQTWAMLEDSGLHLPFLEKMEETIEKMRAGFFTWRNGYEHTDDRVFRLLYHSQLTLIREISGNLLRLSQHIRQAKLGYALIDKDDQVTLASQIRAAENILGHLSAVESILIDNKKDWHFPRWQQLVRQFIDAQHADDRQQLILTFPKNHPLYAWLVQSTLAN